MQTKTLVVGGVAIVAVAMVAAIYLRPLEQPTVTATAPPTANTAQPQVPAPPDAATAAPVEDTAAAPVDTAMVAAPQDADDQQPDSPAEEGASDQPPPPQGPVMTNRRFEPDGALLVSGTAAPNVPVALMIDGVEVERSDADSRGGFVLVGFLGYSDKPRRMDLVSDPDGAALLAEGTFLLDANPAPLVAAAQPAEVPVDVVQDVAQEAPPAQVAQVSATEETPDTPQSGENTDETLTARAQDPTSPEPSTPEQTTPAPQPAASPAILAVTPEGVEVVQPSVATNSPPEVMSTVALDTITYNPAGDVVLQGRAVGEGFVQVYVNNSPISRLPVDENGGWRGDLPDVDTGVYTLRIDEIDAQGEVVSRIETPFLREAPDDVIEAMADVVDTPGFTVATRTVQPGATLWAIAEERYGSGILYVSVFEANKDRIRDPDLIYPGQVFILPEGDSAASGN